MRELSCTSHNHFVMLSSAPLVSDENHRFRRPSREGGNPVLNTSRSFDSKGVLPLSRYSDSDAKKSAGLRLL
jgi:hypothetical protein